MATTRVESGEYKNDDAKLVAPNPADVLVRGWVSQLSDFVHQRLAETKKAFFDFASRPEQYEHAFAQLANPALADEGLHCRPVLVRSSSLSQQAQDAPSYGAKRGAFS